MRLNGKIERVLRTDIIRILIGFAALLLVFSGVVISSPETHAAVARKSDTLSKIRGSFSFAVIGDTRGGGKVYHNLAVRMMEYKPAFVVNTGDVVFYSHKMLWDNFWDLSKPITVPYFLVAGNHDVDDRESEGVYRHQAGVAGDEPYYSFSAGNSLFVVLDSSVQGQDRRITGQQYEWLKQVLSTSGKKHKFIFVHHPLYSDKECGTHSGACLDKYVKERDRLTELFKDNKVTAVFAGHEHLYHRSMANGLMQVITGGGGAPLHTDEDKGGFHHFVIVTVEGDEVRGEVIDSSGKVRDKFQIREK